MINIFVDNQKLQLKPDLKFKFEFRFPQPFDDSIQTSVIQWFEFANNPKNAKIFQNADILNIFGRVKVFSCIVEVGNSYLTGRMLLKEASKESFRASVIFNDITDITSKKLAEIASGYYYLGTTQENIIANANAFNNSATSEIVFPPVKNDKFYDGQVKGFGGIINDYDRVLQTLKRNVLTNDYTMNNVTTLVPFPKLKHLLQMCLKPAGWAVKGTFMEDTETDKLIVYSNTALDEFTADIAQVSRITEQYGGPIIDFTEKIRDDSNNFDLNTDKYIISKEDVHVLSYDIQVRFPEAHEHTIITVCAVKEGQNIYDYIDYYDYATSDDEYFRLIGSIIVAKESSDIGKYIQFQVIGQYVEGTAVQTALYYKDVTVTISPIGYNSTSLINSEFYLKDIVPDVTFSDLISNLAKKFTLSVLIDNVRKELILDYFKEILTDAGSVDVSSYIIKNKANLFIEENIYSIACDYGSDDELIKQDDVTISNVDYIVSLYSQLPPPERHGLIAYVYNTMSYYISKLVDGLYEWVHYSDELPSIEQSNATVEVKDNISTCVERDLGGYILPAMEKTGISNVQGINGDNATIKLLLYHGMQPDEAGLNYPFASRGYMNAQGLFVGTLHLNTDKLYTKYAQPYYTYRTERDDVKMQLAINDKLFNELLKLMNSTSNYRKIKANNVDYLPKQIDIIASIANFESCEITMY